MISCVIPCKERNDPKLKELIRSIDSQRTKEPIEILIKYEGDSESAKGAGIKEAGGDIIALFCADNEILDPYLFWKVRQIFDLGAEITGVYTKHYAYVKKDPSLNRYFALMGYNDPIAYYLDKADRRPHFEANDSILELKHFPSRVPSLGDNGFFYRAELLKTHADTDHYYPMDCAEDLRRAGHCTYAVIAKEDTIHHKTADDLFSFLKRRYRYAKDLYCDRHDRRWKILHGAKDYRRLFLFILATLTIIEPVWTSIKRCGQKRDFAWFWHWPVCFGFLIMYGLLACRNLVKHRSLFALPAKTHTATV